MQFARVLQKGARRFRRPHDRVVIAVQFDAEADDRLAGRGDAIDDFLGPAVLDADDNDRGHVRVAAGADQRAEMQVEVGAELQPPIRMRNRQRALDVVGNGFARRVGQIVDRQDDDVIAHADTAILAAITPEFGLHAYHRFVLMLWTWACCPVAIGATTLPMSITVLDDRIADLHVLERDLVPERNVLRARQGDGAVFIEDQPGQRLAGLDAFDDDDGDRVLRDRAARSGSCGTLSGMNPNAEVLAGGPGWRINYIIYMS